MQIIASADAEQHELGHSFLDTEDDLAKLIPEFVKLNRAVTDRHMGAETEDDRAFLEATFLSPLAAELAIELLCKKSRP
jgi:hypothetical protein